MDARRPCVSDGRRSHRSHLARHERQTNGVRIVPTTLGVGRFGGHLQLAELALEVRQLGLFAKRT